MARCRITQPSPRTGMAGWGVGIALGISSDWRTDGASLALLREILSQRGSEPVQRPVNLVAGDYKWRGDADHVFMGVLGKDAPALKCLAVATCTAGFRVKLDRQHQTTAAYFTDRVGANAP